MSLGNLTAMRYLNLADNLLVGEHLVAPVCGGGREGC